MITLAILGTAIWMLVNIFSGPESNQDKKITLIAYFTPNKPIKAGTKVMLLNEVVGEVRWVDYYNKSYKLKVIDQNRVRTFQIQPNAATLINLSMAPDKKKLFVRAKTVVLDSITLSHPQEPLEFHLEKRVVTFKETRPDSFPLPLAATIMIPNENASISLSKMGAGFTEVIMEVDTSAVISTSKSDGSKRVMTAGGLLASDSKAQVTTTFGLTESAINIGLGSSGRRLLDDHVIESRKRTMKDILEVFNSKEDSLAVEIRTLDWYDLEVMNQITALLMSGEKEFVTVDTKLAAGIDDLFKTFNQLGLITENINFLMNLRPASQNDIREQNYLAKTIRSVSEFTTDLRAIHKDSIKVEVIRNISNTMTQLDSTLFEIEKVLENVQPIITALKTEDPNSTYVKLVTEITATVQFLKETIAMNQANITLALHKLEKVLRNLAEVTEIDLRAQ
jgi:hypothetical protein